jgi:hypothetical protein
MSIRQGTRIAFTGAGGTGKTTSADYIATEFGLEQPKSASRQVYEANGYTEAFVLSMSPEEKLDVQTKIFAQKVKNDQAFSYVTDRTLLDHYAYCLAYCGGYMDNQIFSAYEEQTRQAMLSTYSHIFYFPWGYWEVADDGVRSSVDAWQSQIDALIVGYISRWQLPVTVVPQTDGEAARNEFIRMVLDGE